MLTVNKLLPQGQGLAAVLLRRAASIELDWDTRQKSRFEASDSQGRRLGVFLPRGSVVRGGDVLVAEDGSLIRVTAAPQAVLVVSACRQHGSPFDLTRAAYHLGNRHVPLALAPDHLTLEPDHVLADMLRAMHLTVTETQAAFEPEGGAYGSGGSAHGGHHDHGHDHAHEDGHAHDHAHDPASPAPSSAAAAGAPRLVAIPVLAAQPHVHADHEHHAHEHHADGSCCGHGHSHEHAGHDHVHQRLSVQAPAQRQAEPAQPAQPTQHHHHHHHHGDAAPGNDRPLAHGPRP